MEFTRLRFVNPTLTAPFATAPSAKRTSGLSTGTVPVFVAMSFHSHATPEAQKGETGVSSTLIPLISSTIFGGRSACSPGERFTQFVTVLASPSGPGVKLTLSVSVAFAASASAWVQTRRGPSMLHSQPGAGTPLMLALARV